MHIKNKLYKFAYIILKLNDYEIRIETQNTNSNSSNTDIN